MGAAAQTEYVLMFALHVHKPLTQEDLTFLMQKHQKFRKRSCWIIINYHLLVVFILGIFEASNFEAVYCCKTCMQIESI